MQERIWETFTLGNVADCLAKEHGILVPSDATPLRGPLVEQVMKSEHLDHARANAFVLRRKLLEWQNNLAGHLVPQPNTSQ